MLQYKKIKLCLFTGNFFVTKEAKSTRGSLCMQVFFIGNGLSQSIPNEVAKWFHGGSQRVCEGNRSARDIGGRSASISEEQRGQ